MSQFKREQVMTGPLPDDFLRLQGDASATTMISPPGTGVVSFTQQNRGGTMSQTQTFAYAGPSTGVLSVTVAQSRLAKNYGLTRMDPYCRIRIGHNVYETQTAQNGGKNPVWNKTIRCFVPSGCTTLYIEMYDECAFSVDERIAWGMIEIPSKVLEGELVDDWFPLSGRQGDEKEGVINLILEYRVQPAPQSFQMYHPVMIVPPTMPAAQVMYTGGVNTMPPPAQPPVGIAPSTHPTRSEVVTEEKVSSLKDMFPAVETDVIRSVLEASGGHVDVAINNLLAMNG